MEFDYVIVGGGSGGATLAARLSEDPDVSVCLLEAGGAGKSPAIRTPLGVAVMIPGLPGLRRWTKFHNWAYRTEPQTALNGRKGY